MIRPIVFEDKDQILNLVKMFFTERLERVGPEFSYLNSVKHFDMFFFAEGTLALCIEIDGKIVGMIAGIASAIIFSNSVAMQELVWYVEPNHRKWGLKLLKEFERVSKERGFKYVLMVGMANDPVLRVYNRLGYSEMQQTFIKDIG